MDFPIASQKWTSAPGRVMIGGTSIRRGERLMPTVSAASLAIMERMQQNEITECATYRAIAQHVKPGPNRDVLLRLAEEEGRHAEIWRRYTGKSPRPQPSSSTFKTLLSAKRDSREGKREFSQEA